MSIRANCAGRACRGRIYVPGVHKESEAFGRVESNAQVAYQQVADLIKNRFILGGNDYKGIELVIAPRNNPDNFKKVAQVIPRQTFGIQRRRNIGVGS